MLCPEHWQMVPFELQQQLRRSWRLLNDRQRKDHGESAQHYCSARDQALEQVRAAASSPQPN